MILTENDHELDNLLNNDMEGQNINPYEDHNINNEGFQNNNNNENDLDKENYQLDLDALEEANSLKNQQLEEENEEEEYIPQLKDKYDNEIDNNLEGNNNENIGNMNYQNNNLNNKVNPRPSFFESTSQKVNDTIDRIKTVPEANLEKWNLVADYFP